MRKRGRALEPKGLRPRAALLAGTVLTGLVFLLAPTASAEPDAGRLTGFATQAQQVGLLEQETTGLRSPSGLAFSPANNAFYVIDASPGGPQAGGHRGRHAHPVRADPVHGSQRVDTHRGDGTGPDQHGVRRAVRPPAAPVRRRALARGASEPERRPPSGDAGRSRRDRARLAEPAGDGRGSGERRGLRPRRADRAHRSPAAGSRRKLRLGDGLRDLPTGPCFEPCARLSLRRRRAAISISALA